MCRPPAAVKLRSMPGNSCDRAASVADPIRIELRMDGSAPTGHVTSSTGESRSFSGWIGLIAVVEELAGDPPAPPAAGPRTSVE